jgi:hypothetical protein
MKPRNPRLLPAVRNAILAGTLLALSSGCQKATSYSIHTVHHETIPGRLDGQWFEREIIGKDGLQAIELIYCPAVPDGPLVCRTAVVWERYETLLLTPAAK